RQKRDQLDRTLGDAATAAAEIDADVLRKRRRGQRSGGDQCSNEENSTRDCRAAHDDEDDFGRPSSEAISSSRFSKLLFGEGGAGGGTIGVARRCARRLCAGSGEEGGAIGSAVGRRNAASSRCAISARF